MRTKFNRPKRKLGRPIARFTHREAKTQALLRWYIPGFLLICILFGYGLWRKYEGYLNYGPAAASNWGQTWFTYTGILTPILLFFTIRHLKKRKQSIILYANGLYLKNMSFPKEILYWEEISGISMKASRFSFLGRTIRNHFEVTLYSTLGFNITLEKNIKHIKTLADKIKSNIYPILYPELQRMFHEGQWLYFGEIVIRKNWLKIKNREIPWPQVKKIDIDSGKITFDLNHLERITIATDKIHNLELLTRIIHNEIVI